MNIVQQKIQTFRFSDRLVDLILLFLSARAAIMAERIYHAKSWHALDSQSFNFVTLILIFAIWIILIQIFDHELVYRRTPVWNIIRNTALINFIGVTTTITLDFLFKTDLFQRLTITLFGCFSYFMLVLATRKGDISVISPFRYSRLIFALVLAILVLNERPDTLTLFGAAIIVASGYYTIWRERVLALK